MNYHVPLTEYGKHGLNFLVKIYGVELTQHHRAIYDTEATAYIFIKMVQQMKELGVTNHKDINKSYQMKMPINVHDQPMSHS